MSIGERIYYFRLLREFTAELIGILIGVDSEKGNKTGKINNAQSRIQQYERGRRTPRPERLNEIAEVLEVSPEALNLNVDSELGIMHTLFFLEDHYGLPPIQADSAVCIQIPETPVTKKWVEMYQRYYDGEISKAEYDNWRYQLNEVTTDEEKE